MFSAYFSKYNQTPKQILLNDIKFNYKYKTRYVFTISSRLNIFSFFLVNNILDAYRNVNLLQSNSEEDIPC